MISWFQSSLCISAVAQVSRFTIAAVLTLALAIGVNSGDSGGGFHRGSGQLTVIRWYCWGCSSNGAAGATCDVDSSAACALDSSYDTAARGVNYRGKGWNRLFDPRD